MRQLIRSGSPYEDTIGFSRAVRAGSVIAVSGTAPIRADGDVDPDAGAQARRCLEIISLALEEAGASLEHVVRTRIYLTDAGDGETVGAVHREFLKKARPASTMVVVSGFLDARWKVEIRRLDSKEPKAPRHGQGIPPAGYGS